MLSCIRYMVYPAIHIYYMHNTHNPSRSPGPACHYDPHNAVPQGRPPASTLLQKPGTPLSKALSGKAAGRPLQKKRPSRADSLHYACKPFRVPHTSGALTTCPANATTSRRHGKNPAYCLSINSITQAGYKDKKFICNNELPAAHGRISSGRCRKAYFTGRTGSNSCGHHFMSNYVKKIHPPDISRFPYGDWFPCIRNHSGAAFFVTFPPHLRCMNIINTFYFPIFALGPHERGRKKGSAPRLLHHAFRRVPPT